jgi:peptide/nickel transport system ATP-binding protein
MALLDVEKLNVAIGNTPILKDVSFALDSGEILGLVGESGAGKSMVALSVLRLLPQGAHLSGTIRLDGEALTSKSETGLCHIRGRDIGLIFQEPMTALNPLMTIGDQIAEVAIIHGKLSRSDARALARQTLDRVGLPAPEFALDRYPHELSGGQRQRVAIAIAIALSPKLLLADEPTTALDVTTQAQILTLLKSLVRESKMGLVLVTHDLAVIAQTADRIAVMKDGVIVETGAVADVLGNPQHPYTKALLSDATPFPRDIYKTAGETLLEADSIVRVYASGRRRFFRPVASRRAVDGVSLKIGKGENVGIVGESGSGKSSLLRTILALDAPQSGDVQLDGASFTRARGGELRRMRRRIQAVFQDPFGSFDPRFTVEQIVAEPFHLLDDAPRGVERRGKVDAMLERVDLSSADADRYPHEFSGGQRQRIAIARALITNPEIVVLDEAVSALDVTIRAQILALLADLSDRLGVSYLFVSHDLAVVRAITDRVLVMQAGRIVEEGPTEQVFVAPKHPYTARLIAATPTLEFRQVEK